MSDHVPMQSARTEWDLGFCFLDFVFGEKCMAEVGSSTHDLRRLSLGDCDQQNLGPVSFDAGASCLNAFFYFAPISCQIHTMLISLLILIHFGVRQEAQD